MPKMRFTVRGIVAIKPPEKGRVSYMDSIKDPPYFSCRVSSFGGKTWELPRMLVDVAPDDMNVQAPALLKLRSGALLMICLRSHRGGASSTMCLLRSTDDGKTSDTATHFG